MISHTNLTLTTFQCNLKIVRIQSIFMPSFFYKIHYPALGSSNSGAGFRGALWVGPQGTLSHEVKPGHPHLQAFGLQ